MSDSKAVRLSTLADEIGYALGRGEFPEDKFREFRFLWKTTPDTEKDGLSYSLKDIEEMFKDMRLESANSGVGFLQRVPVEFKRPDND